MTSGLRSVIENVSERIVRLVETDEEFRRYLSSLAENLLESNLEDKTDLSASIKASTPTVSTTDKVQSDESDLALIESRCRLKSEGCRWAAERIRLSNEGADHQVEIAPFDRQLIEKAKQLSDCYLWMNSVKSPTPADPSSFEVIGECFENLAEALALVQFVQNELKKDRFILAEVLQLCAEAQSALRTAIQDIDGPVDHDQTNAYIWVRTKALSDHIFIERFLSADDPADPKRASDIKICLKTLGELIDERRRTERRRRKVLDKLRYLTDDTTTVESENQEISWQSVAATVHELVEGGVAPSHVELRNILIPHINEVPDLENQPQGFRLAIREARRVQNAIATEDPIKPESEPTTEIKNVAKLLKKKKLVLIGGDCRPARKEALEKALELDELVWVETKPGQSVNSFAPFVARPEVAAVVLAIRWSSHSYGEVRQFCDRYSKPLIWLPGGYSPNQVASHILGQCSHRLRKQRLCEEATQ